MTDQCNFRMHDPYTFRGPTGAYMAKVINIDRTRQLVVFEELESGRAKAIAFKAMMRLLQSGSVRRYVNEPSRSFGIPEVFIDMEAQPSDGSQFGLSFDEAKARSEIVRQNKLFASDEIETLRMNGRRQLMSESAAFDRTLQNARPTAIAKPAKNSDRPTIDNSVHRPAGGIAYVPIAGITTTKELVEALLPVLAVQPREKPALAMKTWRTAAEVIRFLRHPQLWAFQRK